MTVPMRDRTPEQQALALKYALDPTVVNPATVANAQTFIDMAGDDIGPNSTPDELHRALALQRNLRDANTPRPRGPFFQGGF